MRPFHETIVDAINAASGCELACLAALIKATKIPQNHDVIIAAWNERCEAMCWGNERLGVPKAILDQKREAEEKNTGDDLGSLNQRVTVAIIEAEKAQREVMRLEIAIANLTSPASVEGRFARRGAVIAALRGVSEERARELVDRFLAENGIDSELSDELYALLP